MRDKRIGRSNIGRSNIGILALIGVIIILMMPGNVYAERTADSIVSSEPIYIPSGISTASLGTSLTATDLVNSLLGGGITVSNVKFTGVNIAAGKFSGGSGIIGFGDGIILSTGDIANVKGPNNLDGISKSNGVAGDTNLDALIPGYSTYDAAVLEFDFVPLTNQLQFKYVFGSDEYNEYVNTNYNDVFGFFVNGKNVALIPGTTTPVSINNVNCGGPTYGTNPKNCGSYINNDLSDDGGSLNTEMDGLTIVLTATANVNAGKTNHIKLAIADAGDSSLDSDVFIEAGSFKSPLLKLTPASATNPIGSPHKLTATLLDGNGAPISGQTITFSVTAGPNIGKYGIGTTNANGVATWSYTSNVAGTDTIVATGYDQTSINVYKTWELSPQLKLAPVLATNYVGESHILTATLINGTGKPIIGQTITFSVTEGPNIGKSGTGNTDSKGNATWSYIGNVVGNDTIVATGYGKTSNLVVKIWQQSALTVVLTPATSQNPVNTKHNVTATVKNSLGVPQSGITVSFSIISGPNSPLTYSGTTNTKGQTVFTYTGSGGIGTDNIQASIKVNGVTTLSNIVKKEWVNTDILAYYRGLGQYPNIVETSDLLKAADDWRDNVIPPGYSVSLTTNQLLTLADEWINS